MTTVIQRKEYNRSILGKCIELLQSPDSVEIFEGVILAAYLIEQSFKAELRKLSPFLYFDRRNIPDEKEIGITLKSLSKEEMQRMKTSDAKRCIAHMCEYKSELKEHRVNLEELFDLRNYILHSTDDLTGPAESVAETAVSALRACRKYVIKCSAITSEDFDPLTSKEFERLQERQRADRIEELRKRVESHIGSFHQLQSTEASRRISTNLPHTDSQTWIEETSECPACNQSSLDKVCYVDFDWNPDGILSGAGCRYQCRVCELELTEYEYELVSRF